MSRLLLLLMVLSQSLFAEKVIHALVIGDPVDSRFHRSYLEDVQHMKTCLRKVAFQANMKIKTTVLADNKVTNANITKWIAALPQNSQDTILVYYAGENAAATCQKKQWPAITLFKQPNQTRKLLTEDKMLKIVQAKNPRLALIFFDFYTAAFKCAPMPQPEFPARRTLMGLQTLFANSTGYVMYASAKNGDRAHACRGGGCLTFALIKYFAACKDATVSWDSVAHTLTDHDNGILHNWTRNVYWQQSVSQNGG